MANPLTREQFEKARQSGLSIEQIANFEKRRLSEQSTPKIEEKQVNENLITNPIKTLAKSGGEFIGGVGSSLIHPVRTAKAIGGTAMGAVEKLIPGRQPQEKYVDALADLYKERYGGFEKAKKTILEDPVGFAADLSTLLSGGGALASKIGTIGKVGKLSTAGKTLSTVSKVIDPIQAMETPLKSLAPKVLSSAEKSYGKVLGPTTQTERKLAEKVIPTLTKQKPFVWSRSGLERATERKLTKAGEALEKGYTDLGEEAKIAVSPILEDISKKQESLKINGVLPKENSSLNSKLNDITNDLIDIAKTDSAPLQSIVKYRKVLDEAVFKGKKVLPTRLGNIKREAQKLYSDAIRKEIASQYPSIDRLNAEFSFHKKLSDILETTVPKTKTPLSEVGGIIGEVGGNRATGLVIKNLGKLFSDNVAWNSLAGSTKSRLSESLARGDIKQANIIILNALKTSTTIGAKNNE